MCKASDDVKNGVPIVACMRCLSTLIGKNKVEMVAPSIAPEVKSPRSFRNCRGNLKQVNYSKTFCKKAYKTNS